MDLLLYIVLPFVVLVAIGGYLYESMTPEEKEKWEKEQEIKRLHKRLKGKWYDRWFDGSDPGGGPAGPLIRR